MPIKIREICKFCKREIIPEKMGRIACLDCLPNQGKIVIDFKDQKEKNEYYREQARKKRDSLLPANRICPKCELPKLDSRSWVCREGLAICRSCNYQLILLKKGKKMDLNEAWAKAFTPIVVTRYKVDGQALRIARESIKVAMRSFAKLCGYSVSWVNELERGATTTITEEMYKKFVAAFEQLKKIPDYDAEIAKLKVKQKPAKNRAQIVELEKQQKEVKEVLGKKMGHKSKSDIC